MIRPYLPSDKIELIKILKLNVPKYFDRDEVNDFVEFLDLYQDTYLTVTHNDEIVGGAGYVIQENESAGYIRWIFFHPQATGLGLGGEVMGRCLNRLSSDKRITKVVAETSQMAYQFFEKYGFKLIKTQKDYWGDGLDLYLMEIQV